MDKRDYRYSPVANELSDFASDALSFAPQPSGEPRDSAWLRWLKFISLIVFPALIFGVGFLFEDYFLESSGKTYYQRQLAERNVQRDSVSSMKLRFLIGA